MNYEIYKMYRENQKLIDRVENLSEDGDPELTKLIIQDLRLSQEIWQQVPNFEAEYERLLAEQKSFTPAQIDFICFQIGEWYVNWKERIIVDLKEGTHRLGYAKEQLKEMICGE
jgi:hypothetical protein